MNFKDFYYNIFYPRIITEDYESVIKQITKIVNNNGLPPESIDNILDVYNNVSVDEGREKAKKDSDLVALTYMYMVGENIGLSIENIKREYSAYLNSETSVNKKLLSDYVTNLQNEIKSKGLFKPDKKAEKLELLKAKTINLIETIHRYQKKEKFSGKIMNEEEDKVYEDNGITIFKADSKQKCIYYGRNSRLCISTKSGNYYWKYRMGKMRSDGLGMTTYFVYWKNEDGSIDEDKRILIDSLGNENGGANKYSWNPISPNTDRDISENELINEFPVLQKPFNQNVFQFIPYGEKEKRFQSIDEGDIGFDKLSGYEDYEMYIQTDQFDSDNWNIIEKNVNDKDFEKLLLLASELQKIISYDLTEKYFSEKQKERYFENIAENPEYSYYYARDVLKGQNVPDIIEQSIAKNPHYSYSYAIYVLKGQNIPDIIEQGIAKNPGYSYNYARDVLKGQNIPDIIEQGIAKNPEYSYYYVKDVLKGQNVPDIIEQSIAENPEYSYSYARYVLKGQNIPDIIEQGIAKNPGYSYNYARDVLKGQNVPDIIEQSIAENPEYSYYYVKDVLKGQNVPDIIEQSIAENPGYSYNYARDVLKGQNVPPIILQGIAKDPGYSYKYVKDILKGQNVPPIILQSILKNPEKSYATDVLKGQNVPDIILQSIVNSAKYSYDYATDVLKGQNVPEIILQSIAESPLYSYAYAIDAEDISLKRQNVPDFILQSIAKKYSYDYAKYLSSKGQNVPPIILQSIAENPEKSYYYATDVLKGQNVPPIILQSIAKDPEYSNKSLTEAKQSLTEATLNSLSTDVIRSNSTNINSIEDRNFSSDYAADASSVIRDSTMSGFIGEGIFDDSNQLVGYGYGYRMDVNSEYNMLEYVDTSEITFFDDKFEQSVINNGIENICTPKNTFYISNLVVDKPYRLHVKPLLNTLLNRISNRGYKYITFNGLSDTMRLFDSARKASRLSGNNLTKLAEIDTGESKFVLFYIK